MGESGGGVGGVGVNAAGGWDWGVGIDHSAAYANGCSHIMDGVLRMMVALPTS